MESKKLESWIKEEAEKYFNNNCNPKLYSDTERKEIIEDFKYGAKSMLPEIKLRDERIEELEKEITELKTKIYE